MSNTCFDLAAKPSSAPASTIASRRAEIAQCISSWCNHWYDSDGTWKETLTPPDTRETIWLCFGLLAGNEEAITLANAILSQTSFSHHHIPRTKEEESADFDIFVTNHAVQMLVSHKPRLRPDVIAKLEGWASGALRDYAGDRQSDYQFHGHNDNMPSKATLGLILGGEYFGDKDAVEHGLWNLRQLRDLLTRRGLLSEYTSPTYSPLSLVNLTEIALHAQNPKARQLARACTERIWADILGHFHTPTGTMGGPYSRAYQLDSVGHISTVSCLLWIALGDLVSLNPVEELNREKLRLVHHHDSRVAQLGILGWMSSCAMEPPKYLLTWLKNRQFPFHLKASAERGGDSSGEIATTFYAEEDFALGTAEGEGWCELQSEVFFLHYRRHSVLRDVKDLRTAYCRYLINDQRPGDRKSDHLLTPHGITHTVQEGRAAMAISRPSAKVCNTDVHALKFSVILPEHFGSVEKIEVHGSTVLIQDGPVYLALRGLNATDWGRQTAIRIERATNYRLISFYNYEGPAKRFTPEELGRTLNGFISLIGLKTEESWEMFCHRAKAIEVLDYFHLHNRVVRCRIGQTILGMSYATNVDRIRFTTINGKIPARPLWESDGLPAEKLPFLGEDNPPNTLEFPYQHLRAIWAPDSPWMIASVGSK